MRRGAARVCEGGVCYKSAMPAPMMKTSYDKL